MTLGPWLVWVPLLAAINLLLFIAIRGRWGRIVPVLGVAAVAGVVGGDLVGERIGFEIMRIGDMNVLSASIAAQLLMLAVSLLGALGPIRVEE